MLGFSYNLSPSLLTLSKLLNLSVSLDVQNGDNIPSSQVFYRLLFRWGWLQYLSQVLFLNSYLYLSTREMLLKISIQMNSLSCFKIPVLLPKFLISLNDSHIIFQARNIRITLNSRYSWLPYPNTHTSVSRYLTLRETFPNYLLNYVLRATSFMSSSCHLGGNDSLQVASLLIIITCPNLST